MHATASSPSSTTDKQLATVGRHWVVDNPAQFRSSYRPLLGTARLKYECVPVSFGCWNGGGTVLQQTTGKKCMTPHGGQEKKVGNPRILFLRSSSKMGLSQSQSSPAGPKERYQ